MEATRGPDDCYAFRSFDPGREQQYYWRPVYARVTPEAVLRHMAGEIEIGAYALIPAASTADFPTCRWIAADFDGKRQGCDWQSDVQRFLAVLVDTQANILVNRSRSGQGVHVRVLFREPVPGWMARRWMQAWLEESGVVSEIDDAIPSSFDRLIPMQDTLRLDLTYDFHRRPGNLVGSPMHKKLAVKNGGTLPIATDAALVGVFEPDGRHWHHLVRAVEERAWGEEELRAALLDAPGGDDAKPPTGLRYGNHALTVLQGDAASLELLVMRRHCAFLQYLQAGGDQPYSLWVALASQLHRFGEAGHNAFHELSQLDVRYKSHATEMKWEQTAEMQPMRCDTLVDMGFRCPHLTTRRCNGAKAPAYFPEHAGYEPL
jgi:hypothetical protein